MSQPAIRVVDLKKAYRENLSLKAREVLKGVSFSVPAGQIFGFLGANGAGKTTTIKIAMGLQAASSGHVELLGAPVSEVATRARIGFLPERPYFHTNLTANEFLDFHRKLYGQALAGRRRPSNADLLKLVGIPDVGSRLLRGFSKGMLQRVGFAQALLNDPDLLILDEPMSGLDPVGRREIRNLLVELNHAGKTIFFSSHILSDIESVCQCIAFLEKGELKYCGKIEDLVAKGRHDFEILFQPPSGDARAKLEKLGVLSPAGKLARLTVPGAAEARSAVEALWAMGAEVESFNPVHRSLEDVLFGEGRR
jgi:ABC-2 type transport system ATP-binding protein